MNTFFFVHRRVNAEHGGHPIKPVFVDRGDGGCKKKESVHQIISSPFRTAKSDHTNMTHYDSLYIIWKGKLNEIEKIEEIEKRNKIRNAQSPNRL